MFARIVFLTLLSSFGIYWFFIRIRPEDPEIYHKLVSESIELRTRKALEHEPAIQKRQGVQKDIWTHDETRHFQIQSRDSGLIIRQKKDKIEASEHLKEIQCITPNEITLTADEGIYAYPTNQFVAENNCQLTQKANRIDGTRIHLDLEEETLQLENPNGHIASGTLDFTAKSLIWDKDSNLLHLIDDVRITQTDDLVFLAKKGIVHLKEYKPVLVVLEGSVRLISSRFQDKESYAMADTLTYNPIEKTFLFGADRRVLFWQDGLTLSASEVLIRQDQTIEGHGNVHFTFDLEEQNRIDEFFKQYL
ncbi:MAG: hypothetical protein K1X28_06095 [Parachlamydiales bacterium]|nr:hypothetical protein [Parachlamydiales bacterium]